MWVVAELQPAGAAVLPLQLSVDPELSPEAASGLGEDLKAAIDDVMADKVEGMVWKIDDLSEDQAADLLSLPDGLQALVVTPLDSLARAGGLPAPVTSFSSDVAGTVVLKPIMEPVKRVLHGLEVVGTIAGLLTGAHGLVLTCVKHLARDMLGDRLSEGFGRVISGARIRSPENHRPVTLHEASHRPARPPGVMAEAEIIDFHTRTASNHSEPSVPREPRAISGWTGRGCGPVAGGVTAPGRPGTSHDMLKTASPETRRAFRSARELYSGDPAGISDPPGYPWPGDGPADGLTSR